MERYGFIRCLFCQTGNEEIVAQLLEYHGCGKAISPRKVKRIFRKGQWVEISDKLLPGYLFVYSHEPVPYRRILAIPHVLRILHYVDEPEGYLQGKDRELALFFLEKDGTFGSLQALKVGNWIQITDGLLHDYDGKVIRMDRRKQMALIQLNVAGDVNQVWLSYELMKITDEQPLEPSE